MLVTGGAGFLGTHLVQALLASGLRVKVLDLRDPVRAIPGVTYRQGCVTDGRTLAEVMARADLVFHLAAQAGMWAADKGRFIDINRLGTRRVLNVARRFGNLRVVHVSTESILFPCRGTPQPRVITEHSHALAASMASPYQLGKWLAEAEAWRAVAEGQDVVVVNPTVLVGPDDPWCTPFTRTLLGFANGTLPAYLNTDLNLVDARDVADLLCAAARIGRPGERFLAAGHQTELRRVLEILEAITGRQMTRRRVPHWLAYGVAACMEFLADRVTHRPPKAPLAGVRIARRPVRFDGSASWARVGLAPRSLEQTLADVVADAAARGLTRRPSPGLSASRATARLPARAG